jgi:hypothetical protein
LHEISEFAVRIGNEPYGHSFTTVRLKVTYQVN